MKLKFLILLKDILKLVIVVSRIDYHIRFSIAENILQLKMVIYLKFCLFNCYHYSLGEFLDLWKKFQLELIKETVKPINSITFNSVVREYVIDVYAFDWNIDGSITKVSSEKKVNVIDLEEVEQIIITKFK